jgi:hypothetical protein
MKSAKTVEMAPGILVDYAGSGEPIGLEITAPAYITVEHINAVLKTLGLAAMTPEAFAPLNLEGVRAGQSEEVRVLLHDRDD